MRIVIADDQKRTRQSLKALLSTSLPETEIWEAANGAEALRLAEETHPQLVVMDIRMPEVDGISRHARDQVALARDQGPGALHVPGQAGRGEGCRRRPFRRQGRIPRAPAVRPFLAAVAILVTRAPARGSGAGGRGRPGRRPVPLGQATETPARSVLLLHSYQQGPAWVQNITDGVLSAFAQSRDFRFNYRFEYMNILDADPSGYAEVFRRRLGASRFDIVICVDNQALEFLVGNRASLFAGVPIVFCSIDDYSPELLKGETDITGVTGELDFEGTIEPGAPTAPRDEAPAGAGQPEPGSGERGLREAGQDGRREAAGR